ncbi:MAG: lytic transglycosylase domain-containing protein [Endomicrobium sp.]|jgi:soluble lytic murein transglycosylase|nr:lytic transglycosylase domain-containing protein [Endomicrobium sp.]
MKKIVYIIFIVIILTIFVILQQLGLFKKNIYNNYIYKYSGSFNVDPILIKAIMKKESNLNINAISSRGAVGLMQIMPKTANEISKQLKISNFSINSLKEPKINIMFGVYYISKLLNYYNNNLILALSAYNAGIGNVDKWYKQNKNVALNIKDIPFKETQYYVKSAMFTYKVYKFFSKISLLEKKNK